jgi:hypothetical protein
MKPSVKIVACTIILITLLALSCGAGQIFNNGERRLERQFSGLIKGIDENVLLSRVKG